MVDQNSTKRKWKTFKTSLISIMVKRRFCILRSKNKSFRYLGSESEHHLVVSDFLWPHGLYSPWNSLGLWKILKEMGIPDHLTCLLRNLYAGQESTVRTGHGTTDWFQIGKGICQGCILSLCLFNLYAEYIMKTLSWKKHELESRLLGEISITSDMKMTPPLWQKVQRN